MASTLDKNMLKEALRDLIREEPAVFKSMLREILIEEMQDKDETFEYFLEKNFERFDETFRALV